MACTAGGIGGAVFPLLILYLAPSIGFGWSIRIIALVCLVCCVPACFLLQKRLPNNRQSGAAVDFKALLELRYGITTVAAFLIEFAVFIPYTYLSSYAIYMGLSREKAYLLNVYLNIGAIPGRALPGLAADRFGVFNTMCVTAIACAVTIFVAWLPFETSSETPIIIFSVLYGVFSGAAISLTPVCIGRLCDTKNYGKRIGTTFSLASIGTLIGIPLAGVILQSSDGGYQNLIIFAGAAYLASALVFVLVRVICAGWKLKANF